MNAPTLPCPFCGDSADIDVTDKGRYVVECGSCPAKVSATTEERAIAAWNRRSLSAGAAVPPDLKQQIMNLPCKMPGGPAEWTESADKAWTVGYKYGHRDARHAAAELVSAALSAATGSPWISVEEQLPPVRLRVLIGRFGGTPPHERTLAVYDPERYTPPWRYYDDWSESIRDVTHWMHLPTPPESAAMSASTTQTQEPRNG